MEKSKRDTQLFLKHLGQRIKQLREEKGMSQRDLGLVCEIEKSNIGRIENGRTNPTIITLRRICKNLDVLLKKMMDFEDKE